MVVPDSTEDLEAISASRVSSAAISSGCNSGRSSCSQCVGAASGEVEEFHVLHRHLARASGSRPIGLFVDVLADLTAYFAVQADVTSKRNRATIQQEVARAHSAIIEAVIARDVPLAQHRMMRHLEATIESIRR